MIYFYVFALKQHFFSQTPASVKEKYIKLMEEQNGKQVFKNPPRLFLRIPYFGTGVNTFGSSK